MQELARLKQRDPRLAGDHLVERAVAIFGELLVELRERLAPGELPLLHVVEPLLHPRGVPRLEEVVEVRDQELEHGPPEGGRQEPPVFLADVLAVLELPQDLGVRGRPADPVLLQELHERRLVVARGRLRCLALGLDRGRGLRRWLALLAMAPWR